MSEHHDTEHPTQASGGELPPIGAADYWTTLSEYERDEDYLARIGEEFYPEAKPEKFFDRVGDSALLSPMHRRTFLKFSGFAALLASLSGCERPVEKIVPYVNKPEEILPGVANHYASTCTECPAACGLLVKTREGRPIKLEGNPQHPLNKGALCTKGQAGILRLYDPDRQKWAAKVGRRGKAGFGLDHRISMARADEEIGRVVAGATGQVVLLTPTVTGPSNRKLVEEFTASGGNFRHVAYDPLQGGEVRQAHRIAFGEEVTPRYRWEKARAIVSLGGDPVGQSISPVEAQAGIAAGRRPTDEGMSRLIVFEPTPTPTGMLADYRHPVRPGDLLRVGLAVAHELILNQGRTDYANNGQVRALLEEHTPAAVASRTGVAAGDIVRAANALAENAGRSLVCASSGASRTEQALELELLAAFLNHALGNYGETIDVSLSPSQQMQSAGAEMLDLVEDMKAGRVEVLLVQGLNPVYTLPASLGFEGALEQVRLVVSMGLSPDETAARADYLLPAVHGLESWGDAEPQRGLYSIQQPTIRTLFGEAAADDSFETRPWQESLMGILRGAGSQAFTYHPTNADLELLAGEQGLDSVDDLPEEDRAPRALTWYDFLRETWENSIYAAGDFAAADFRSFWTGVVREGVLDTVGHARREGSTGAPSLSVGALAGAITVAPRAAGRQIVTQHTTVHGDGTSMGNPQLLELPDPVSKVCWDNHASFSPAAAEELRISEGQYVTVKAGGSVVRLPAWIQPGQHPDVVAVNLGWGRDTADGLGDGVGASAFPLQMVGEGGIVFSGHEVEVTRERGRTKLANIQGHNYLYSPAYAGIMVNRRKVREGEEEQAALGDVNERGDPVYARPIIGETTWREWKEDPFHGYPNHLDHDKNAPANIWERSHKYDGHHWGMSVDLNACNGCGACIVACSIENNVPVVGKEEVLKGREMHWIRIDRYYRGDKENPDFVNMPLMCQHCDNAPCETVCPVIATMHNDEGLNVMTYNRCVGTRYCANNCPYKVRRFNFWQYTDFRSGPYGDGPEGERTARRRVAPLEMVLNPDITTRTRGVMEKCTFCIARIRDEKNKARLDGQPLPDGQLQTACQQTCPAKALHFGDRNDVNSKVSADWLDPRGYGLLADMNTDPSVRYLALVRNRDEPSPYRTKYQANRLSHHHGEEEAGH